MKFKNLEQIWEFEKSILHFKKLSYILYALVIAEVCIIVFHYLKEGVCLVTIANLSMFLGVVSLLNLCLFFKSLAKIEKLLYEIIIDMEEEYG